MTRSQKVEIAEGVMLVAVLMLVAIFVALLVMACSRTPTEPQCKKDVPEAVYHRHGGDTDTTWKEGPCDEDDHAH